ncbi:MAG: hypothetical protein J7M40_04800 [Planctomycetes bacterium]|nr:hypothetical protein [Planctomycetota bacterium]
MHDNLSQEFERVTIPLKFKASSSSFYSGSTQKFKSKKIAESGENAKYTERLDFGTLVDGNEYSVLVADADDLSFVSENSSRLCKVKLLRTSQKEEAATLREGYLFLQKDVSIKLKVCPKEIGIPSTEPVPLTFRMTIYSSRPPAYDASLRISLTGALSGSTATDNALVGASITCKNSLELTDRYLNLSVKPYDDRMSPLTTAGKIPDMLTLGSAKLVVEKITADCSEVVLALLHGDLVQEKAKTKEKGQAQTPEVGKPFPAFARVDLLNRCLLTLDDLTKEAGSDGCVALVFGDFKSNIPPQYSGMPQVRKLSLDEAMICEILKKDLQKSVIVAFACQELPLSVLYEKWLGADPGFYVFSDFSNPLKVQFGVPGMQRPYYGRPVRDETLRGQLALPETGVATALINGQGDLVYLNTEAGTELAGSLVHINKLIGQEKPSDKQDSCRAACDATGK